MYTRNLCSTPVSGLTVSVSPDFSSSLVSVVHLILWKNLRCLFDGFQPRRSRSLNAMILFGAAKAELPPRSDSKGKAAVAKETACCDVWHPNIECPQLQLQSQLYVGMPPWQSWKHQKINRQNQGLGCCQARRRPVCHSFQARMPRCAI